MANGTNNTHIKKVNDGTNQHLIDALHSSIIYITEDKDKTVSGSLEGYVPGDDNYSVFLIYCPDSSTFAAGIHGAEKISINGADPQSLEITDSGLSKNELGLLYRTSSNGVWTLTSLKNILRLSADWQKKIKSGTDEPSAGGSEGDIYIKYSAN